MVEGIYFEDENGDLGELYLGTEAVLKYEQYKTGELTAYIANIFFDKNQAIEDYNPKAAIKNIE